MVKKESMQENVPRQAFLPLTYTSGQAAFGANLGYRSLQRGTWLPLSSQAVLPALQDRA